MSSISSGDIRISWSSPSDIGGNPILGYKLYVNSTLVLDASTQSTLNTYTFTGLSVGRTYNISVTAVNEISESQASYFYIVAASVPQKLTTPVYIQSTTTYITIQATYPGFDGGSSVTQYVFTRDNGPLTDFITQVTSFNSTYTFTGL